LTELGLVRLMGFLGMEPFNKHPSSFFLFPQISHCQLRLQDYQEGIIIVICFLSTGVILIQIIREIVHIQTKFIIKISVIRQQTSVIFYFSHKSHTPSSDFGYHKIFVICHHFFHFPQIPLIPHSQFRLLMHFT